VWKLNQYSLIIVKIKQECKKKNASLIICNFFKWSKALLIIISIKENKNMLQKFIKCIIYLQNKPCFKEPKVLTVGQAVTDNIN
jgi:hypothetical protein